MLWFFLGSVILNGKLIEIGVIEEFSEKSSTVIYIPFGSLGVHVEKVSSTATDLFDDEVYKNEVTIWQLFVGIQTGYPLSKSITMPTSFLTGQTLYLVQSNSKLKNKVRGFRFVNSDKSQYWDILILVRGNTRRLRGAVIRGVIILVNGKLSNVIVPLGDWSEVKAVCIEKLPLLNPKPGNETESVSIFQQPPSPPPPSPPVYMNVFKANVAERNQQQ